MRSVAMALSLGILLLAAASGQAQQRDPTRAPDMEAAPQGHGRLPDLGELGLAVLARDGQLYLASGTRLYAVGQTVGGYRIERISETEIWLKKGKELQKIPRYSGVIHRALAPERPTP